MKKQLVVLLTGAVLASAVFLIVPANTAKGEYSSGQATSGYPIGKAVEISLVAWPLTSQRTETVRGDLITISGGWVVVKDGSYENWVPQEKVMYMRASK